MYWRNGGTGHFATSFAEGCAFLKSDLLQECPDLQPHLGVGIVDDHIRALRPYACGRVPLNSTKPSDAPRIEPQYLSDPGDLDILKKGA